MLLARRLHRTADDPRARFLAFLLALLLMAVFSAAGRAQSPCGGLLDKAEKCYEEGDFEQVPELLEACTKGKASRQERADAYALTAKAYVMSDRIPQARLTIEALLRVDPEFEADTRRDPSRFIRLVAEVKRETAVVKVASVSKSDEPLREAPATVVVVTAEEIQRRGYSDLEALIHDLPAFDISRTVGAIYANIYQRGYRSDETNRTLILVDGVEENDVWAGTAYISRQYPLINVDRVEVIYGPSSTMYGANAFAGVINVITKEPAEMIAEGRRFGARAWLTGGAFNTRSFDANVAGRSRSGAVSWSLTCRRFQSDEFDLSDYEDWDYDLDYFETVNYRDILNIEGAEGVAEFESFLSEHPEYVCIPQGDCVYRITENSVELTDAGVQRAIALDQMAFHAELGGRPIAFSNPTSTWALSGKLQVPNLELGFLTWRKEEGATPWYTDRSAVGANNGLRWSPTESMIYIRYSKSFSKGLSLNLFSRYKLQDLGRGTEFYFLFSSYFGGALGMTDLVAGRETSFERSFYYISNTQLRNELSVIYQPSERWSVVSGIELRDSSIMGDYIISGQPNPAETGAPATEIAGGNHFDSHDLGVYTQVSYAPIKKLKLVAGGRIDYNKVRETGGFGMEFNPRLALIYRPADFVLRAVYAEAFRDPPNFNKYATVPGIIDIANPGLEPEKVKNFELGTTWEPRESFSIDLTGYDSRYSSIVQKVQVPCDRNQTPTCPGATTGQYQNSGALQIRGIQLDVSLKHKNVTWFGNYTYTDPVNTEPFDYDGNPLTDEQGDPISELRIGDIASHQFNLGLNAEFRDRFNANLRFNYVGEKKTGKKTTVILNPFDEIGSSIVIHGAFSYEDLIPHTTLQLIVQNLLDEEYYHPGHRDADGTFNAARVPQSGRAIYLRLLFKG